MLNELKETTDKELKGIMETMSGQTEYQRRNNKKEPNILEQKGKVTKMKN